MRRALAALLALALAGCMVMISRDVPTRDLPWPFGKDRDSDRERKDK